MTLDVSNPLDIIDFALKITVTIFALYYFGFTFHQYRQKPTRARKILGTIFICLAVVAFLYTLDFFLTDVFHHLYSLIVLFMGALNIGLLYFGTEIFASDRYEKSTRSKIVKLTFSVAQMIIAILAAIFSWYEEFMLRAWMMAAYLLLSVGLNIYLIQNSYKLALRVAKTNPELVEHKRAIIYIGNTAVMILLVYIFLAIQSFFDEYMWGRPIWIFILLVMFFIYQGFIKPAKNTE